MLRRSLEYESQSSLIGLRLCEYFDREVLRRGRFLDHFLLHRGKFALCYLEAVPVFLAHEQTSLFNSVSSTCQHCQVGGGAVQRQRCLNSEMSGSPI